jgi:hypothetical protein
MSELLSLLKGEKGTAIVSVYADLPTDPDKVTHELRNEFVSSSIFRGELTDSLIAMSKDAQFSWFTLYYIYSIIGLITTYHLPVDVQDLISAIEPGLKNSEAKLKVTFDWVGAQHKNGLWGDVERMSKNIFERFGYEIYPRRYLLS